MENKEIYIDGVDVSGCKHYKHNDKNSGWSSCTSKDEEHIHAVNPLCCEKKDCRYKKLKRKEQELEYYKIQFNADTKEMDDYQNEIVRHLESIEYWVQQFKAKEQECEKLKEERNEYFELMAIRTEVLVKIANKLGIDIAIIENKEIFNKIDQLKAENDELRQFLAKEPLALQALQSGYADYKKRSEVFFEMINQYKQTLTEIKEIAEKRNYLDYNECLDDILQKISECEVE